MVREIEGNLIATGKRFAVVAGRFNSFIVDSLIDGAVGALVRHGADASSISVVRCPGSFELPMTARRVVDSARYDAVICLGVLIRGATSHFDWIAAETTSGISRVAEQTAVPVTYGVLTCDTIEQAIERAGTKSGNKGSEAAVAAIEMANLYEQLAAR